MSLCLLSEVLVVCGPPVWGNRNETIDLTVHKDSVSFDVLRKLETSEVYPEKISSQSGHDFQADYNSNKAGVLTPGASLRLRLPRVVGTNAVAKCLEDLLSLDSATYQIPRAYYVAQVEDSNGPFCYDGPESLSEASPLSRRYHDAVTLWETVAKQAEHLSSGDHRLLFFGIRRTEIAPSFGIKDLSEDIALSEIVEFLGETEGGEIRKDIFHSVLSEFLQDQDADRAFSYLLRQSPLFARRLREGLAIYLSEHSPEKLAKEAQAKYLDLAETLEKIISGMEAKSLSIPAAVLLAVKEAEFGQKWTTLNTIIIISTGLYLTTMIIVFLSQRATLSLLKQTIHQTTKELVEQGLDAANPILSDSFAKLEGRRKHTKWGSWLMVILSLVPLAAVIYAVFCASPSEPASYTVTVSPTNSFQIIQNKVPIILLPAAGTNTPSNSTPPAS